MNIFKEVKERSDILEVARAMGLDLNRYNKGAVSDWINKFSLNTTPF